MYTQPQKGNNRHDINTLLNDYTYSVIKRHCPLVDVFNASNPKSEAEFLSAINGYVEQHRGAGAMTVQECAEHALRRQQAHGCNYTTEEIHGFVYDLMVTKTMLGALKENQARQALENRYPEFRFEAAGDMDATYAVDIVVRDTTGTIVCAIQVKPNSYYTSIKPAVVNARKSNPERNRRFSEEFDGAQVFYLIYNTRSRRFTNYPDALVYLENVFGYESVAA